MISNKDTFVIDVDGTLCTIRQEHETYSDVQPIQSVIDKVNSYYDSGCHIILFTARGMLTYNGDEKLIEKNHRKILVDWLAKYGVQYHELRFGKPWGKNVVYVDDMSVRPEEFINL